MLDPRMPLNLADRFHTFASRVSAVLGAPAAFLGALGVVLLWLVSGPVFHFSDTWQLAINTGTTIVTFLMVFLIQNTQNRDAKALHLKLDELIRANRGARNALIDLQDLTDSELQALELEFRKLRDAQAPAVARAGKSTSSERSARPANAHRL